MNRSRLDHTPRTGHSAGTAVRRAERLRHVPLASAISAILAGMPLAAVQAQERTGALEEVVVTAQKRTENLQDVPVAIVALGNAKLEELHIANLDDYVKFLPSVSYVRGEGQGGNGQPGSSHVYMRGIASGGEGNHSGPQPSVGTYLDEQPVTTIDGTVDVHVYDIARVEVLEGPQGTLYGASSEAGTIRIITNKPDPTRFQAGYDLSVNSVNHGGIGYEAEGFLNLPMSPVAAVRLVAWDERDAGFINNVAGTSAFDCVQNGVRTFPTWAGQKAGGASGCPSRGVIGAGAISNAAYVKDHYNTVDTKGGRAAMKVNLGDNWTVTPSFMGQVVSANGFFAYDPSIGDLALTHFGPESSHDSWTQGALTVEGKIHDFDVVYAGAFMKRNASSIAEYSDYSLFYDRLFGSGAYWLGNNGQPIMPQQLVISENQFEKWSHELRFSTPQQYPLKATAGLFVQRQMHNIWEQYAMPGYGFTNPYQESPNGLADSLSIPTLHNTIWLTAETRVDRDSAAFAQATWDISPDWSAAAGLRYFKVDNTLQGFYGYSNGYHDLAGYSSGEHICFNPNPLVPRTPCTDLDKRITETGHVPRATLNYKFTPDKMAYLTFSKGFRPGGVNRTAVAGIGPYQADFLKNYELGWKTQWMAHRLRWNGSLFWEDWNNFQFSFLGPNSVNIITNGGNARVKGIESELEWAATNALSLSLNMTLLDPRLQDNYCNALQANGSPVTNCPTLETDVPFAAGGLKKFYGPLAPAGTNLPVTPKFKGNVIARYAFALGEWEAHVQGAMVYQTKTAPLLRAVDQYVVGLQPAYALFDLSGGVARDNLAIQLVINNVMDRRAELTRFVTCTVLVCEQPYVIPAQPRTIGLKFGQKF